MRVAGIDGWRGGWVAVVLDGHGTGPAVRTFETFEEGLSVLADVAYMGVDIPMGLTDDGLRPCDIEARKLLGSRRSTLFLVPPREVLMAPDYKTAKRLSEPGRKPSLQMFGLREKILDVKKALDGLSPTVRVFEAHPELSFLEMTNGTPLAPKKSWNGLFRRVALLREAGIELPAELPLAEGLVPPDDILDAAAVAWTARRFLEGRAIPVPARSQGLKERSAAERSAAEVSAAEGSAAEGSATIWY
ncbi:MAG: DUF429 domain-containing protein [Acidobacteria bacterium]|nr:DUF429 domain-containing protein [Acidobacteriota bacterium]